MFCFFFWLSGVMGVALNNNARRSGYSDSSEGKKATCIDLFAGAGGFSLSALNANVDVRLAIELDRHACTTYEKNILSRHAYELIRGDMNQIEPQELYERLFDKESGCDIVLGGPPCQGFSRHRLKNSGVHDPRNQLILRYFKFVEVFQPKFFLMENVPGMLWPKHKTYLDKFYKTAKETGYKVYDPQILDARDFGVPQRRKRVFILGVRQDLYDQNLSWPLPPTHSVDGVQGLSKWENARIVFDRPVKRDDPNDFHMQHTRKLIDRFKQIRPDGGSRTDAQETLPCHVGYAGHKDVYGRIDRRQPGPTMTASCTNPSKGRFVHPVEPHGITIRQAARFQTFPDDFIFHGGLTAAGKQIGNAVPIKLGEAVLKYLVKNILKT